MRIFTSPEKRNLKLTGDEQILSFLSTGTSFTSAKAIENSDVFTIINLLSSDVASLDVKNNIDGVKKTDSITKLFNVKPNNLYSGGILKFILSANALLNGESFVEIIRDDQGKPFAFSHIPNSQVNKKRDKETNYKLKFIVLNGDKKERVIDSENMLHFKFFTLDGINGVSPLKSLKDDLSMQKDSKRFLANFFRNDTQTGGLLKMKHGKLSKEARDKIKEEWQKSNAGVGNAHKVLVIDDTFDYEPIEVDTEILKLINASTFSTETIGKVYRIPRHKLGLETSNMSLETANLDYLTSTLNSYLKVITNELNFKLDGDFEFDTAPFKTTDVETHTRLTLEKVDKGLLTLNQALKELGHEPVENEHADKHFISLNYTTLDQLEEYQMAKAKGKLKGGDDDG